MKQQEARYRIGLHASQDSLPRIVRTFHSFREWKQQYCELVKSRRDGEVVMICQQGSFRGSHDENAPQEKHRTAIRWRADFANAEPVPVGFFSTDEAGHMPTYCEPPAKKIRPPKDVPGQSKMFDGSAA